MRIIFIIFLIVISCEIFSQGIIIRPGANFVSNGAVNVIIGGNGGWTNNGAANLIAGGSTSTVKFVGNSSQLIGGSNSTTFYNLTVTNSGTSVNLGQSIIVNKNLTVGLGYLDLLGYNVDLGTTGFLAEAGNTARVIVTGGFDGRILASPTLVSGLNSNISGLRISINSTSYTGLKNLSRGHKIQAGTGAFTANSSATLFYLLPLIGQLSGTNQITINYMDGEYISNTAIESNLMIFHQIQQWGVPWLSPVASTVVTATNMINNTAAPYEQYVTDNLGTITFNNLVTIGSTAGDHPLPINLTEFKAVCLEAKIGLEWTTTSEINNDYFTIEKSTDGSNWYIIETVFGAGNSNNIKQYSFFDTEQINGTVYYRLKQTDFNGNFTYSAPIVNNCKEILTEAFNNLIIYSTLINPEIVISFNCNPGESYSVTLVDQLGRKLYAKQNVTANVNEQFVIPTEGFAMGIYHVVLNNSLTSIARQIPVLQK